jgi:hypothetical protein
LLDRLAYFAIVSSSIGRVKPILFRASRASFVDRPESPYDSQVHAVELIFIETRSNTVLRDEPD